MAIKMKEPWIETPLVESAALSRAAGCEILLKLENLQRPGSFKMRGIGNLVKQSILAHPPGTKMHFFASSGGNAGLACVHAAKALGYPASVVVPTSTKPDMVAKLQVAGASNVTQLGDSWQEADTHLREVILPDVEKRGIVGVYVPPFDHEAIWTGHASMISEIKAQLDGQRPDAVICAVGGGGLLCGVMEGLDKEYGSEAKNVSVIAIETIGAESLYQSVQEGKLITLPSINTIASSLGARQVCAKSFEYAQQKNVVSVTCTDAEAAMGTWRFADDERLLVGPECGASLSLAYTGKLRKILPHLNEHSKVVVVVCGGSNITVERIQEYRSTYAEAEELSTNDTTVPSTNTAPGP